YNRYRYYQPEAGIYNAQDPLGISPNIATPQGYVTNPTVLIDYYGLQGCPKASKPFDSCDDALEYLKSIHGGKDANRYKVFEVANEEIVEEAWKTLKQGHEILPRPGSSKFEIHYFKMSDEAEVQRRSGSRSGGVTLDIFRKINGTVTEKFKLHVKNH
ncbi:MAG: hypothetical protein Q4D85_11910, partial [Corynebacterium sp.]|uniref:hypothetical protein n=1 Tax=Corynebacterium sp. TaxID=1720 RepID=UPI0026DAADC1